MSLQMAQGDHPFSHWEGHLQIRWAAAGLLLEQLAQRMRLASSEGSSILDSVSHQLPTGIPCIRGNGRQPQGPLCSFQPVGSALLKLICWW